MTQPAVRRAFLAVTGLIMVAAACTRGQSLRGTTSLAVKAALAEHNIKYKGNISCTGNNLPINCTGTTVDGKPISGILAPGSGSGCVITVTVGGQQITRQTGGRCK
jgi:hypothetical protein